jgi:hypothetical protein
VDLTRVLTQKLFMLLWGKGMAKLLQGRIINHFLFPAILPRPLSFPTNIPFLFAVTLTHNLPRHFFSICHEFDANFPEHLTDNLPQF